jgi:small subunit ribosomal protein S36
VSAARVTGSTRVTTSAPVLGRPDDDIPVAPVETRTRLRETVREAPRTLWVVVALFGCLLAGWSVLMPLFHATDEPNHVDRVLGFYEGHSWPAPGDARVSVQTLGLVQLAPFGTPKQPLVLAIRPFPASEAVPRAERPALRDVTGPAADQGQVLNQLTNHPPGYYMALGAVLRVVDAKDWRWDVLLSMLRLLNVLFILPLPVLAWAAAHRLTRDASLSLTAAVFPFALPTLTHLGASVNNDNLLILFASLLTVRLVFVVQGDLSRATATWVGVLLGLALFTKGLALPLVPWVLGAYVLAAFRTSAPVGIGRGDGTVGPVTPGPAIRYRDRLPGALRELRGPLGVAAVVALALGGWWWFVNLLRYHTLQPTVPGYPVFQTLGPDVDLGRYLWSALRTLPSRWWGVFGCQEAWLPALAVQIGAVILLALLGSAFVAARRRRGATADLVFLVAPTLLLLVFVFVPDTVDYLARAQVAGLHGRYLYGGLIALFVAAVTGLRFLPPQTRRWMPLVFLVLAGAMQAVAVRTVMRTYWIPYTAGSLKQGWTNLSAWSPWSPDVMRGLLVLGVILLVSVVALLIRGALRSPRVPTELGAAA